MKKLMVITALILIAGVVSADLCGPWSTITDFYDRDLGLTDATIRVWDCWSTKWLTVSGSTTGGNGAFDFLGYDGSGNELYETNDSSRIFQVSENGECAVVLS